MRDFWKAFGDFFVSLKLTVVLLVLSMFLVFFATLDQTSLGIYAVQEKWFRSFVVIHFLKGVPLPVYPGGYFIGGLLLINLVASHFYRFRFTLKKSGIWLTHIGLIVLLLGELFSGLLQEDYQMRLDEGQTKNYSENIHDNELAIVDASDPQWDTVVTIPEKRLSDQRPLSAPALPFRVVVKSYFPNANLQMRNQAQNPPPSLATAGFGQQIVVFPLPITYRQDERNTPAAYIELIAAGGNSLGTWLVSTLLPQPETITYDGKPYRLSLRFAREYKDFSITLLDFAHDRYPGTEIPKNFSSKVRLSTPGGKDDREVLIYMNNPLRYAGLTFYQASFDNNDRTSILQVVRNPGWTLPYVACVLMTLGLVIQFLLHLVSFAGRQRHAA